ncbi:MAG: protein jag [Propionibacteriaceae bacterium]|nr:protein jag [Propionibacteriaceae bacterium]
MSDELSSEQGEVVEATEPVDVAQVAVEEDEPDDADSYDGTESALDQEGDAAADYLEELLDIVDMDGDIDTYVEGDRAHVSIVTDSQTLVGKNGEVLDALQELARLAVLTDTGRRSRLILDVAGYRDKRRQELLIMAQEAVAEVKRTGEPARLPAMNPFERKIVHDAVAEAGLTSESEGVEPQRRVVVSTK